MTVGEAFTNEKLDKDFIQDVMDDGRDYWKSAYNFISQNWDKEIESLSLKQAKWFGEILDDCIVKRIEG